jgi:hypothetical protein
VRCGVRRSQFLPLAREDAVEPFAEHLRAAPVDDGVTDRENDGADVRPVHHHADTHQWGVLDGEGRVFHFLGELRFVHLLRIPLEYLEFSYRVNYLLGSAFLIHAEGGPQ